MTTKFRVFWGHKKPMRQSMTRVLYIYRSMHSAGF